MSEDLIRQALAPYDDIVIATKGGLLRTGPGDWRLLGKPDYLRQAVQMSMRRLGVETIDLYQLHRIDPEVDRGRPVRGPQGVPGRGLGPPGRA